jgi:hypothetical protein
MSRFKVGAGGVMGILVIMAFSANYFKITTEFKPFENIVICFLILQMIFMSLFFIWWGLEPYMDISTFTKKKRDES